MKIPNLRPSMAKAQLSALVVCFLSMSIQASQIQKKDKKEKMNSEKRTLSYNGQTGLKVGQRAPMFSGTDQNGKVIDLKKLLKTNKSIVLFFYRGQWCPYCNKHIKVLQDSMKLLTEKNAYIIGVTPETKENINVTVKKTNAAFSMIQDIDDSIMKAYGVNFRMDDETFAKYKTSGVDLEANNGNKRHTLPVPATYIIDSSGKIKFVHFDANYQKRVSIKTLLGEL